MKSRVKHISSIMNAFIDHLPDDQRKKILVDRKVKQIQEQFACCVDPFILDHVNSIYLIKEENESTFKLTVYVDSSAVAAELNARRELIVLKYRELFGLEIKEFIIKISRGAYRERYPYRKRSDETEKQKKIHHLTPEEEEEIRSRTSSISDADLRESFSRVLRADKEHPLD